METPTWLPLGPEFFFAEFFWVVSTMGRVMDISSRKRKQIVQSHCWVCWLGHVAMTFCGVRCRPCVKRWSSCLELHRVSRVHYLRVSGWCLTWGQSRHNVNGCAVDDVVGLCSVTTVGPVASCTCMSFWHGTIWLLGPNNTRMMWCRVEPVEPDKKHGRENIRISSCLVLVSG